jgi:two-component system OmpR family sensor kinase
MFDRSRRLRALLRRLVRPKALHGKLIVVVLTSLGLGLSIACVGTYLWMRSSLLNRVEVQLSGTAKFAQTAIAQDLASGHALPTLTGDTGTGDVPREWNTMLSAGLLPSYLEVRDVQGRTVQRLAAGGAAPVLAANLAERIPAGADHVVFGARSSDGSEAGFRVRLDRLPHGAGMLVLAVPLDDVHQTLIDLEICEIVVWAMVFTAIGWLTARRITSALRPLDRIGEEAMAIRAGDLDRRVTPTDPETEVGRLGIAVNTMLGRHQEVFAQRQASEERLRRFVADASHELRTPLTSIRGYAELFRRGASDRPQDLALAMVRIESEAARMGALVDELLLLARLDSGRPLERSPVDLMRLAQDAVADFRISCPSWPIELDASPVSVLGDGDRLRQVLANLLANVRQHTPSGTQTRLSVRTHDDAAVVEVVDSGPGLTAEQCAKVFERFYRVDAARARSVGADGGSGLGLSIVDSVVSAHGGRAVARPGPDGGLVVAIEIPRAGAAVPDDTACPASAGRATWRP